MQKGIEETYISNQQIDPRNHPFDDAIKLTAESDGYRGHTSKDYANMVGPFGGVIAAMLLKAALDHPEHLGEPLALTVNYAAPIADGDFNIKATPVKTNRSTQHWSIILTQQGQVYTTATAVFAARRTTFSATDIKFPTIPDANDVEAISTGSFPPFFSNYDVRIVSKDRNLFSQSPDDGAFDSTTIQWIKDKPGRVLDFLSLTAICDMFIPRIFVRRGRYTNIGTVSLTIYFHTDAATLTTQGDKEILGQARAQRFHNNYFDQTGEVWSVTQELLATTSQIVYFKE